MQENKDQLNIEVQIREKKLNEEIAAHKQIDKLRAEVSLNQEKLKHIE